MECCVSKIDWKKAEETIIKTVRDCHSCPWFRNGVCKTILPCLAEKLQTQSDATDDLINKQVELEEKIDNIIKSLRGKAEAEYKKSGGI